MFIVVPLWDLTYVETYYAIFEFNPFEKNWRSFFILAKMAERTRVRRKLPPCSTCFSLKLPSTLACTLCERSCEVGVEKRKKPKCKQPWLEKWGYHRQTSYVQKQNDVRAYLNMLPNGDIVVEECIYRKNNKNKEKSFHPPPCQPSSPLSSPPSRPRPPENMQPPPRTLTIVMNGEVFSQSDLVTDDSCTPTDDSCPPSPEPAQSGPTPPPINTVVSSESDESSCDGSKSPENFSELNSVATNENNETTNKKRRATELLETITSNLLELKRLRRELPSSTSLPSFDTLREELESMDPSQFRNRSNKGEGGRDEVLVNGMGNRMASTTTVSAGTASTTKKTMEIYKPYFCRLQNAEDKLRRVRANLEARRYNGSERGNRLLGSAMAMVPKAGYRRSPPATVRRRRRRCCTTSFHCRAVH